MWTRDPSFSEAFSAMPSQDSLTAPYPHRLASSLSRPTLEQWFENPFVRTLVTSESLGWNNITVRASELNATPDYVIGPPAKEHVLLLAVEGSTQVDGRLEDGAFFSTQMIPGALAIIPRFYTMDGRWDASVKGVHFHLGNTLVNDVALSALSGDPERIELIPTFGFFDPFLRNLATELHRELQNGSLFGPLFAESVARTVTIHLLSKYSNVAVVREVSAGKLTAAQLRLLDEYIHTYLHEKISLANLANCLHVSVPHFEKMFRATFHCPPYHYVLERRIERAKLLLSVTQLSLHEVAHYCGFANQSHFTKHFTKFVGVSPARFMRGVRT